MPSKKHVSVEENVEVVPDSQVANAMEECLALLRELADMPGYLDIVMSGVERRSRADKLLTKIKSGVDVLLLALQKAGSRPAQSSLLPLAAVVKKSSHSFKRMLSQGQAICFATNRGDTIYYLISYNQEE